jgi:transglutaminase-like putative cysteine protease
MTLFQVSCQIHYDVACPSTLILNIHPQCNESQKIIDEHLIIKPRLDTDEFTVPGGESRFVRLETGATKQLSISYKGTIDCDFEFLKAEEITTKSVADMDRSVIPFLFPSRYCQSDRLSRFAWDYFGSIAHPYEKVIAIVEWIHENVEYASGSTDSETSAFDTVTQRTGVCRDFAHLGIALCRALTIPARYFSGYAYQLEPPDFHACFEAHIGGKWLIFDATRLAHANGLVRIGAGRDAADAAVCSIYGRVSATSMKVECELAPGQHFAPVGHKKLKRTGVSLDAVADK